MNKDFFSRPGDSPQWETGTTPGSGPLSALKRMWERFIATPTHEEIGSIRDYVAQVISKYLDVPLSSSRRVALELIHDPSDPDEARRRQREPISKADLVRVKASILGIDVIYQPQQLGSGSTSWLREIRIFLRDVEGQTYRLAEKSELSWTDLPNEVRGASIDGIQGEQRFVLYGGESRNC